MRGYVFTGRSARPTTSGGGVLLFTVLLAFSFQSALRGQCLAFYGFIGLSTIPTPSGGSIFRCTAKDRGERRAKGIAIPLNPLELMF